MPFVSMAALHWETIEGARDEEGSVQFSDWASSPSFRDLFLGMLQCSPAAQLRLRSYKSELNMF